MRKGVNNLLQLLHINLLGDIYNGENIAMDWIILFILYIMYLNY